MPLLEQGIAAVATDFSGQKYVGLIKSDGDEVDGGGYQRVSFTGFQRNTEVGNTDSVVNNGAIDFGTATGDWGSVVKARIYTTSTGETGAFHEDSFTSRTINTNDTFQINSLGWVIDLD